MGIFTGKRSNRLVQTQRFEEPATVQMGFSPSRIAMGERRPATMWFTLKLQNNYVANLQLDETELLALQAFLNKQLANHQPKEQA